MSFLKDLKKDWLKAVIGLIVVCSISFGEKIINVFSTGVDIEFENKVSKIVEKKIVSAEFMTKIMTSPFMIDYKLKERDKIIKDALHHGDSTKVKLSANLVAKTGMNKEAMADTLASIISSWVDSKGFVNQTECIYNSKKYGRGQHAMQGM